jgi:ATP-dependent DNA helicase RecG
VIFVDRWLTDIKYIRGVGPARAAQLACLGINTVGQALEYYPKRYEDHSNLKSIQLLKDGENETFCATIVNINEKKIRNKLTITKMLVRDSSGTAYLIWFNKSYIKKAYKPGMQLVIFGKAQHYNTIIQIQNPDIEEFNTADDILSLPKILPVYPSSEKINQRFLRMLVLSCLDVVDIREVLPKKVIEKYHLLSRTEALKNIHFPKNADLLKQARYRLVFEELYLLQCGLALIKRKNKTNFIGIKHLPDGSLVKQFELNLPFSLTDDQRQVIKDIKADMEDIFPMQRLVQGDVGSGKTVVAAVALIKTVENGYQGAMMAPTELLAEQHYSTMTQLFAPLGIRIELLTGKLTK